MIRDIKKKLKDQWRASSLHYATFLLDRYTYKQLLKNKFGLLGVDLKTYISQLT